MIELDTSRGKALRYAAEDEVLFAYDDLHPWQPAQPGRTIEGTLTIGRGHTGPDVRPGLVWTHEQSDDQFDKDWHAAVSGVMQLLDPSIPVTGNQLGAMASLAFNIGARAFAHSYVLERFNKGDMFGAASGFSHFESSKGERLAGLVKMRLAEKALFNTPDDVAPSATVTAETLNAQQLAMEDGNAAS